MRFVVNDGYLLVYADVDELADGIASRTTDNGEVQVLAIPLEHGTNNESIVEPLAQGIASVLEGGWRTRSAKVRDVVALTEHAGGIYSWLSTLRTGACEGINILDAMLDMGIHFIMNHEDQERHLGSREYQAISAEDGLILEVCQALLEHISVPPLFADSDLLEDDDDGSAVGAEDGPFADDDDVELFDSDADSGGAERMSGRPTWRDYEEYHQVSTEALMQKLALGEEVAGTPEEWEERVDWLWSYEEYLREQWRRTVVDHLMRELAVLRRRLEDLEVERQRTGDAIARLEEQGNRFAEDG